MQVYLIGFMGAGKTSLGKRLANRMTMNFYDSDQEIENAEGLTIAELFKLKGETHFRTLEKSWVENFDKENSIISLGGGTPCQEGMMDLLNDKGITVYIKPNNGIIASRLGQSKTIRPLIEPIKNDKEALLAYVETTVQERERYYLQSKIVFESSDVKAEKLDDLIRLIAGA